MTEADHEFDRGDVHPNDGGCWFCHHDGGYMAFSLEFDAYYHPDCAEAAGVADEPDPILAWETSE